MRQIYHQGDMSKMRGRGKGAFTLVELLVVIAVVTLLSAIILPVLWGARNRAYVAQCKAHLQQIGQAIRLYTEDWDGFLPRVPGDAYANSLPSEVQGTLFLWTRNTIRERFEGTQWTPSSGTYLRYLLDKGGYIKTQTLFRCPSDKGAPYYGFPSQVFPSAGTSYLWDPWEDNPLEEKNNENENPSSINGLSLDSLSQPAKTRLLQDYGNDWHMVYRRSLLPKGLALEARVNAVFADGHADLVPVSRAILTPLSLKNRSLP